MPLLRDADGAPLRRNFVHVDDLVAAILIALDHPGARQRLFNVAMDEPVDYGALADYLAATRGLPSVEIASGFHSTWLDNARARLELGWRPAYDLPRLVEAAWGYVRAADDPRRILVPGLKAGRGSQADSARLRRAAERATVASSRSKASWPAIIWSSRLRARETRLLTVPTRVPSTCAASS